MNQQFPYSGQQRRGITPVSTAFSSSSARNNASSESPSRSTFTSANPSSGTHPQSSTRQNLSRASSVSSSTSPFPPLQGAQQPQSSQLLSSARSRTIATSNNLQLASSAGGSPAAPHGAGGANSGGGGPSRLARGSPSLSQSSGVGSPTVASNPASIAGGSQQSLAKIVIAQVFLLLSTLNSEKDKAKREQQIDNITSLVSQHGTEVFVKYFRRLIMNNAAQIFQTSNRTSEPSHGYQLLLTEAQKLRYDAKQVDMIAEALDTNEGDVFRDFDLSTFMEHVKLDAVGKVFLALAMKTTSKADLRTKGDAILSSNLNSFFTAITNPTDSGDDLPVPYLCDLLDRFLQNPPRSWTEDNKVNLHYAIMERFGKLGQIPPREVMSTLHIIELLGPLNPLVRLIHKTGPRATSSLEVCREVLANAEIRDINYTQVASVLLFMVVVARGQAYNPSVFVTALREHRQGKRLDWQDVVHAFDRVGLVITKSQFLGLYRALLPLAQEYENFDIQLLWGGTWQQVETQLSFVVAFLSCTSEELDASTIPRLRKAFTMDLFEDAADEVKDHATKAIKHPLVSLDAVEALFRIVFASQEAYAQATRLGVPDTVINPHTDFFVLSVAAVPRPWGPIQEQAFKQLFMPFLRKVIAHDNFVFQGLWKRDARWLAARLIDAYQAAPLMLDYIFKHALEHEWLDSLLQAPSQFSVDLAALAHSEGCLEIESWLEQTYQALPEVFPRALSEFVDQKAQMEQRLARGTESAPSMVPLAVKTVVAFLNFLQPHLLDENLIPLLRTCINAFPRIINYGEGMDETIDANSAKSGNAMSPEADASMQEHFKKMYNRENDVREIVEALRKYKSSEDAIEQDLFSCMIAGLFDEYSCFPEYPPDALATTAVLFGSIINFNLLSSIPLQAALAMVLEAVQGHSSDSKMFKFGLEALSQFRSRLSEWPTFCERLLQVHDLQSTEIWPIANDVVRGNLGGHADGERNGDANDDHRQSMTNGETEDYPLAENAHPPFACLYSDPPLHPDLYEDPDEDVQDKVLFILNNVSERNLGEKLRDLRGTLQEKHHQWFASYLVVERAKVQANFQQLYLDLLEQYDHRGLSVEVLRESYQACVQMLNAQATMESSTERTNLKNLATWLGSLTIARDRPIKYRNICFKDLLVEAHQSSRLLVVIPFTCKVLLQAARSRVFRPPNPWTMEIVKILVELYLFGGADMKLQLKFEVEVLCKDLDLSLDDLKQEPSTAIRESVAAVHEEQEFMPNVGIPDGLEGFGDLSLAYGRQRAANERVSHNWVIAQIPADLSDRIQYPPFTSSAVDQLALRNLFTQAARNSIQEIIYPVVERSVTIAAIATTQLVTKDYATEPDVEKFRKAAQSLVGKLAGSLADVTCKEPLRMSISNNLRGMGRDISGDQLAEGVVIMFVNDNIDMACRVIQHAGEAAALLEIDRLIEDGVRARQAHANAHGDEPFCWPSVSKYAYAIPDPYKPVNYGGLHPEQLAIYENFKAVRTVPNHMQTPSSENRPIGDIMQDPFTSGTPLQAPSEASSVLRQGPQQQQRLQQIQGIGGAINLLNGAAMNPAQIVERIDSILDSLAQAMKNAPEEHLDDIGRASPIRDCFNQLHQIMASNPMHREQACAYIVNKVWPVLYSDVDRRIEVEILVQLLAEMARESPAIGRDVNMTLVTSQDEDKLFNHMVTPCLINARLLEPFQLDIPLAKAIRAAKPAALDFFSEAIEDLLLAHQAVALRTEFAQSLEALAFLLSENPDADVAKSILTKLDVPDAVDRQPTAEALQIMKFGHIFDEWVQLVSAADSPTATGSFVRQLHQRQVLKDRESTALFLRACLELSVESYEQEEMNPLGGTLNAAYLQTDALARLMVSLTIFQVVADGQPKSTKTRFFDYLISLVIVNHAHHQRTRGERTNQKVFFRLYSSILCELTTAPEAAVINYRADLYEVFGKALLALQPAFFPSFAFAWVSLVSHRHIMPAILDNEEKGWDIYVELIEILFAFLGDITKSADLDGASQAFYLAVLRLLLVLHHDSPDFVSDNHIRLLNALPPRFIQLRNLIVSAVPASVQELPDPLSNTFKIDRLESVRLQPVIRCNVAEPLKEAGLQKAFDSLLRTVDQDADAVANLAESLGSDRVLISAAVLYIGTHALKAAGNKTPSYNKNGAHAALLRNVLVELVPESRYNLILAIANQLRYPNTHTAYFSYAVLDLFSYFSNDGANIDIVEQITRVLLESLLGAKPHSWGIMVTLLEIYKNSAYRFWELPFVKAANEHEHDLFNNAFSSVRRDWRAGHEVY